MQVGSAGRFHQTPSPEMHACRFFVVRRDLSCHIVCPFLCVRGAGRFVFMHHEPECLTFLPRNFRCIAAILAFVLPFRSLGCALSPLLVAIRHCAPPPLFRYAASLRSVAQPLLIFGTSDLRALVAQTHHT